MDQRRGAAIPALLVGALTPIVWFLVWMFGAAIGGRPEQSVAGMLAVVFGMAAASSGLNFLLAWAAIRLFGFANSALFLVIGLVLLHLIEGAASSFGLSTIFIILTFPALGAVALLGQQPADAKPAPVFSGQSALAVLSACVAIFAVALLTYEPRQYTTLYFLVDDTPPDLVAIEREIASGVDIHARGPGYGDTALHNAAGSDSAEVVQLLLEAVSEEPGLRRGRGLSSVPG